MLHDAQRTSAPSACSVSISAAVWIVMCSEPVMRAPRKGCGLAYSSRIAMRPGTPRVCCARVFLADRHEAGHLSLRDADLLAAPVGEFQVRNGKIVAGSG